MKSIAIIGSGIAGLSAAWLLSKHHRVTLYEAEARLGGHSHSVDVTLDGHTAPVDTGFLVCNDRSYPNLLNLFKTLDVSLCASDMSFSVQVAAEQLEWSGTSLATVFGDKRNLLRPEFWRMTRDVLKRPAYMGHFLATLPLVLLFVVVQTVGEVHSHCTHTVR